MSGPLGIYHGSRAYGGRDSTRYNPSHSSYNSHQYSHYSQPYRREPDCMETMCNYGIDTICDWVDPVCKGIGWVFENVGTILEKVVEKVMVVLFKVLVFVVETAISLVNLVLWPINWTAKVVIGFFFNADKAYEGVVLDRTAFHRAPEPFDLTRLAESGREVLPAELVIQYRRLHGNRAETNRIANIREFLNSYANTAGATEIRQLEHLVNLANTNNPVPREGASATMLYNHMYHQTVRTVVQNIILELRKPQVSVEKKKRALSALAEAQWSCPPRRLAECIRQYRLLATSSPAMEQLLLGYLQDIKEEIFLTSYQGSQFHVINYVRSSIGEELGLDTNQVFLQDPYIGMGGHPLSCSLRAVFYCNYTTERVVQAVMTRIQLDDNNQVCTDHIHAELRRQAVLRGEDPNTSDWVLEEAVSFFDEQRINAKGVIFLLKSIGILIPA